MIPLVLILFGVLIGLVLAVLAIVGLFVFFFCRSGLGKGWGWW